MAEAEEHALLAAGLFEVISLACVQALTAALHVADGAVHKATASASVFITCKEKVLGPLIQQAMTETAQGAASECTMLMRRLRVFTSSAPPSVPKGRRIPDCGACFANMVLQFAYQS